jgi:hypothetical protein
MCGRLLSLLLVFLAYLDCLQDLITKLRLPVSQCTVEEPHRSAILTMFRHCLASDTDLPPGIPWLPLTPWQHGALGMACFVVESFCPIFASKPDPTLWTMATECLKQDLLTCGLQIAHNDKGEGSTDLIKLGYDRSIKLFEPLEVDPKFKEQHLRMLRNSKGCSTSGCKCPHHDAQPPVVPPTCAPQ